MKNIDLKPLLFFDDVVHPGECKHIQLPISQFLTQGHVSIPIHVVYGSNPGPTLCLTGTLHGDEICGIEIMRQIISKISAKKLQGILIFVPVVNVFGFMTGTRYLPDRRDLNRCFPGSKNGSMASRLAYIYSNEVIAKCDFAIDFHTAAVGKINFPQVRANLDDKETEHFARLFNSPVIVHSKEIKGSLRQAARAKKCKMIVFESGEVNRFDPASIRVAVGGIFHVLQELKMFTLKEKIRKQSGKIFRSMKWVRAPKSGLFHSLHSLGVLVKQHQPIGVISTIFGETIHEIKSPHDGMIMGVTTNPKVYQGDAIIHIAK